MFASVCPQNAINIKQYSVLYAVYRKTSNQYCQLIHVLNAYFLVIKKQKARAAWHK